jgi:hypothetical protein
MGSAGSKKGAYPPLEVPKKFDGGWGQTVWRG